MIWPEILNLGVDRATAVEIIEVTSDAMAARAQPTATRARPHIRPYVLPRLTTE